MSDITTQEVTATLTRPDRAAHAHASAHGARPASGEAELLPHDCDGIREYDNPMPFWWSALFWATFIFSVPYFVFYHAGGVGQTLAEGYESEVGAFYEQQAAKLGDLKPDNETILALMSDEKKMLAGRAMFKANCATCHASDGGGRTGPNLTDDSYLNVRAPKDIFRVLKEGVIAKGMPAWDKRYSEPQLVLLSSYVAGLRGTTPASAKEAQGDRIAEWSAPAAKPAEAK